MKEPLLIVGSRTTRGRIMAFGAIVAALLFAYFSVSWQFGNMLAELTQPTEPNAAQVAGMATSLAPSDPMPRWLAASKAREDFSTEGAQRAAAMFADAVRLSPQDFRWWIELGRAFEQAEQADRADAAFLQAIETAPGYTYPHWQYGNFLIRQGRSEEAFEQLKEATRKSPVYREQVFSLAWDYFGKDAGRVEALAADTPEVRANLALFYAVRGASADSLRMWNSLPDDKKTEHVSTAKVIAQGLHDKRLYKQALEFAKQTGIDSDALQESVTNGGFETVLGKPEDTLFGWRIYRTDGSVDIAIDNSVKREGERSLKINFRNFVKREFYNISQIMTVRPGARYRLSFAVRTENLKSGGTPFVEVVNPADNSVIASTKPFEPGTADWQEMSVEFTAPENTEGIGIRTARAFCGDECPLIGIMWYDDFRLISL